MVLHFWAGLGMLGLCVGLGTSAFGEVPKPTQTTTPQKIAPVPLVDRDPCDYPKLYYCTQPDDVHIGRYRLKIPHNLIGQWPPGEHFIELLPRWPGMRGSAKDEKFGPNLDIFDIVHILIHTARPQHPTEAGIRDYLRREGLSSPVPLPELGLLEYRKPQVNNIPWAYIPMDQAGLLPRSQPLLIDCWMSPLKQGDDNTIECHFGYTLRDGLYVTVRFYKRHLKDWKAITTSVHDLVESFIQE
jgi:hypothetical protein